MPQLQRMEGRLESITVEIKKLKMAGKAGTEELSQLRARADELGDAEGPSAEETQELEERRAHVAQLEAAHRKAEGAAEQVRKVVEDLRQQILNAGGERLKKQKETVSGGSCGVVWRCCAGNCHAHCCWCCAGRECGFAGPREPTRHRSGQC